MEIGNKRFKTATKNLLNFTLQGYFTGVNRQGIQLYKNVRKLEIV